MTQPNQKTLDEVLAEVTEALNKLDSDGHSVRLPRYTDYGGLRVVESDRPDARASHRETEAA